MKERPAITAIAPWFGGKRILAPAIVGELGRHRVYWEPFCGSMAVLMVKPECSHEHLNDLHGDLINLARVIQNPDLGPKLYRQLRRTWLMEELQVECKAALTNGETDPLRRAFCYFIESWIGRNGVSGTHSTNACFCIRYTAGGGAASKRWRSAVDSIPAWRMRMRNIAISNRDAFEMLPKIEDTEQTSIYCDPPYFVKSAQYVHDFKEADHSRLAECLRRFHKARVVVSYYDDPHLESLYSGWTFRRFDVPKKLGKQNKRGEADPRATEVLLLNGLSYTAGKEMLF